MTNKNASYKLRIPNQTDNLEIIRNFVSGIARKAGFKEEAVNKIELAVDEACSNVIEHSYQKDENQHIDIAVRIDYQKLIVIVTDHGKSFDFSRVGAPDMKQYLAELRVGGLGIYLMKMLMDEVEYQSVPGVKNEVRMVKYFVKDESPRRIIRKRS
jgi:serine/threonine-protein kinase RsbW